MLFDKFSTNMNSQVFWIAFGVLPVVFLVCIGMCFGMMRRKCHGNETNEYRRTLRPTLTPQVIYNENARHTDSRTNTLENSTPLISASTSAAASTYPPYYSDVTNNSVIDLPPAYNNINGPEMKTQREDELPSYSEALAEQNTMQESTQSTRTHNY